MNAKKDAAPTFVNRAATVLKFELPQFKIHAKLLMLEIPTLATSVSLGRLSGKSSATQAQSFPPHVVNLSRSLTYHANWSRAKPCGKQAKQLTVCFVTDLPGCLLADTIVASVENFKSKVLLYFPAGKF